MPKLNQILAVEKGAKDRAQGFLTQCYQTLQKGALLTGFARSYEPINEDGEQFPPEHQRLQLRTSELVAAVGKELTALFDVTAQKDFANCEARADVEVDGKALLTGVPATYLLWMEKRLVDLHTFVTKLPTLPSDEDWKFDEQQNCYRSDPRKTAKSKKLMRPLIKYEATPEHPAQVEMVGDDVLQGYWTTTKYCGGIPATRIAELRDRVETLQAAVKFAREKANLQEAQRQDIGSKVFGYLFA